MKKYMALLALSVFFIALAPFTQADSWYNCSSNILWENANWTFDGVFHSYANPTPCPTGCDATLGRCNPTNWNKYMGSLGNEGIFPIAVIIIGVLLSIVYVARKH